MLANRSSVLNTAVWTMGGLVTYYLFFAMRLATRQVHFAGCMPRPNAWYRRNYFTFENYSHLFDIVDFPT